MEIKDSGERREFETGAVRDICEGKGRCDLMPLDVLVRLYSHTGGASDFNVTVVRVLTDLLSFEKDSNSSYIYLLDVLIAVSDGFMYPNVPTMLLEVSKHFEEGAKKYGESNWQKGIPIHCYIDSAIRHFLKWLRGDKDEPHDRAFVWNIMCCIWTYVHCPEMNDICKKEGVEQDV